MPVAGRSTLRSLAIVALLGTAHAATAQTSAYEVRQFDGGPAWFVFDETVDVALHILRPDDPKCHEIGEIILLFEDPEQLRDGELVESAALKGMTRYAELCQSLGANPSNQRKVAGLIVGAGAPDAQGRVMGDARVLDAAVSSFTGSYQLRVRRNAVTAGNAAAAAIIEDRDQGLPREQAESEPNDRTAPIAQRRASYDAALRESEANARAPGLASRLTGGDRAALTGVWSGSKAECARERLILFELEGTGTVEWWRMSDETVGLLPWRTGRWELRDGTVIMSFNHRVEYDDFLQRLRDDAIDETVQFELQSVDGSELRLAATGGGISPEALFLGGAEKLFVRCGS